jgi:hypothetical protein
MACNVRPGVARGGGGVMVSRKRRLKKRMAFFPPWTVSAVPK